jgi:hypothetical protein
MGLNDWVAERREEGESREALIAAVHQVTSSGPQQASRARQRLAAAILKIPALAQHKLVIAAQAIAKDTTNKMSDFYARGEERKAHPADEWAAAVAQLADYRAELDAQERSIRLISPAFRQPAKLALATADQRFTDLTEPDDLPTMMPRLDALRDAVDEGLVNTRASVRGGADLPGLSPSAVLQARRSPMEAVIPLGLTAGNLGAWIWIARVLTLLVLVVALAYAFVTIKQSSYETRPLFSGGGDYLTLFAAALASGASATVLALVGNWRPVAAEDEEA